MFSRVTLSGWESKTCVSRDISPPLPTLRRMSDLSLSSKEHALLSDRGHLGSASTASKSEQKARSKSCDSPEVSQPTARTSGKRSRSLVDLPDWLLQPSLLLLSPETSSRRPGEFKRPCPQFNYPHEISWTTLITEVKFHLIRGPPSLYFVLLHSRLFLVLELPMPRPYLVPASSLPLLCLSIFGACRRPSRTSTRNSSASDRTLTAP